MLRGRCEAGTFLVKTSLFYKSAGAQVLKLLGAHEQLVNSVTVLDLMSVSEDSEVGSSVSQLNLD